MSEQVWVGAQLVGVLIESPEAEIVINRSGVAGATLNYSSDFDNVTSLVRERANHPDFPWLVLKDAKIRREEANLCRVAITYEGVSDDGIIKIGGNVGGSNPRYSLKGSTVTAPIQTHPNFARIAGNPDDPNSRAEWDDENNFKRFKTYLADGTKSRFAGVTSWLMPTVVYEETVTRDSVKGVGSLLKNLGKIDQPPQSPTLPTDLGLRNWFLSTANARPIGNGVEISRQWKLSGPHGWEVMLYEGFDPNADDT